MTKTEGIVGEMDRVALGAALLDRAVPGWESRIRVETLFLSCPCDCVLGQLFRNYDDGLAALGIEDPIGLGFAIDPRVEKSWTAITAAWRELIRKRFGFQSRIP